MNRELEADIAGCYVNFISYRSLFNGFSNYDLSNKYIFVDDFLQIDNSFYEDVEILNRIVYATSSVEGEYINGNALVQANEGYICRI